LHVLADRWNLLGIVDMDGRPELVLASASPRRIELLRLLGLCFRPVPADLDETPLPAEPPAAYVARLARGKAQAVSGRELIAIGADTAVVIDEDIVGKPADADDARATLRRLSGRAHEVRTGLAVVHGQEVAEVVVSTYVWFTDLDDATIDWYVATGEPLDKAGAYGIQGIGGAFVEAIQGSYHNVVGLPLVELDQLMADLGWQLRDWAS
jgi:septum formation protein